MTETKKLIKASGELQEEIAAKLKVTTRSVRSALAYDTNSPTARLIRSYALNHGAKKFNCYAGVAPCSYSSGSSQHSKAKVSHRADKVMKRLLHLAAVAVTHRVGGELKKYYERKVAEGKNKMLVINALRAKIVARMFAVIKRNEKYKPIYHKKLAKIIVV